jgi:hypothetical protein
MTCPAMSAIEGLILDTFSHHLELKKMNDISKLNAISA